MRYKRYRKGASELKELSESLVVKGEDDGEELEKGAEARERVFIFKDESDVRLLRRLG